MKIIVYMGSGGSVKAQGYFVSHKRFLAHLKQENILARDASVRYLEFADAPQELWACYARWQEGGEMELAGFTESEDELPAFPSKPIQYTMEKLDRMCGSDVSSGYNVKEVVESIKDYSYEGPPNLRSYLWDIPPYVAIAVTFVLMFGLFLVGKSVLSERDSVGYDLRLDPASLDPTPIRFPQAIQEIVYYISPDRVIFEGKISPSVVESLISGESRVIRPPEDPVSMMKPHAFDPVSSGMFVQYIAYGLIWELPDGLIAFDMETDRIYGDVSRDTLLGMVN